mgnify:CR=1 FL=1
MAVDHWEGVQRLARNGEPARNPRDYALKGRELCHFFDVLQTRFRPCLVVRVDIARPDPITLQLSSAH